MDENAEILVKSVPVEWEEKKLREYIVQKAAPQHLSEEELFGKSDVYMENDLRED